MGKIIKKMKALKAVKYIFLVLSLIWGLCILLSGWSVITGKIYSQSINSAFFTLTPPLERIIIFAGLLAGFVITAVILHRAPKSSN